MGIRLPNKSFSTTYHSNNNIYLTVVNARYFIKGIIRLEIRVDEKP